MKLLQDPNEWKQLLQIIRDDQCKSYLEIGSWDGGSLWDIANVLPKGSRVVAIDLPDPKVKTQDGLKGCADKLRKLGYDVHLFFGDSTNPKIVSDIERLGPFDFCLIDGDHSEPFVLKDWNNYGKMARIVAFHDIAWPDAPHVQVRRVWSKLKEDYTSRELISQGHKYGIGVLWRN